MKVRCNATSRPPVPSSPGFTLFEMLVGLLIASLIVVFVSQSLRAASHLSRQAETMAEQADGSRATDMLLRRVVSEAYPAWRVSDRPRMVPTFSGQATRVVMSSRVLPLSLAGGYFRISLALEGERLVLRWMPEWNQSAEVDDEHATDSYVIADRVASFRVGYFGASGPGQHGNWKESWTDVDHLPNLIRLSWTFKERISSVWTVIAATHVAVDSGCVFDALTFRCRGR